MNKYRIAHFTLSFLPMFIGIPLIFYFTALPLSFLLLILLVAIISDFAFWYEWKQAVDPDVEDIYGNYKNFQKDSRGDIRMYVLGLMSGFFIGFIVYIILVKLL